MSSGSSRRRQSPAVYRRRRLVLLVALVVIAVAVWLLISQPWRGNAAERPVATAMPTGSVATTAPVLNPPATPLPSPTPLPTPAPEPTPQPTVSDVAATPTLAPTVEVCSSKNVTVDAATDQSSYARGQNPQLSIQLTNHGSTDCTMNVGSTTQVFTITSGNDIWWRSTDCQTEPSDMVVLISAGQTVSSAAPVVWDRSRSSVSSCDSTNRPTARSGGASYHLRVSIGGIASSGTAQFLLN